MWGSWCRGSLCRGRAPRRGGGRRPPGRAEPVTPPGGRCPAGRLGGERELAGVCRGLGGGRGAGPNAPRGGGGGGRRPRPAGPGPGGPAGPQAKPPGGRFRRAEPDGFGGAETACGPVSAPCRGLRRAKKKSPAKARPFPTKIILPSVVLRTGNSLKGRWWRHRFSLSLSLLYARGRENSAFLIENWVTIW